MFQKGTGPRHSYKDEALELQPGLRCKRITVRAWEGGSPVSGYVVYDKNGNEVAHAMNSWDAWWQAVCALKRRRGDR